MNIYLDNNVFVDVENGNLRETQFLSIPGVRYFYSDAHMGELLEGLGNPKLSQQTRIHLIERICGNNFIVTGVYGVPEFLDKAPAEIYYLSRILDDPKLKELAHEDCAFMRVRESLGFDKSIFNNIAPEKVLQLIDERLQEREGIALIPYLMRSEAYGGKPLVYTLLNMVDIANYWGDRETNHSNVARLYDASHAYFAKICDVLVSNDKKMRQKIQAVYSFMGVRTKIMSVGEFLSAAAEN